MCIYNIGMQKLNIKILGGVRNSTERPKSDASVTQDILHKVECGVLSI